ncbi:putative protein phosphatase 2C family, PPM-type phosphatase domain superfamily [Helianthus annuus]|uniref:PPM-type phosphatase domain-containing protein n=1 Tax=Helianthus annuus TaxID=4232 RepID=A0A9K3K0A8_HELAN|nr:putative protein phosphatase 2C family, PPM-type phosphatase domain superfamily [Helianthus annuus]KAJ0514028.1 putative PPM-type phosphatase domain superfamily [Helianthus annuus]KAJ0522063.1 putative protein phosphatase 2C family, PPM-type phosphatase domain superfamily [Helianthus annuus]KAJ0530154.1 putative PPM-type phosphatase domain superfamily [Helianthus annuus]KAJ0697016.1 putative PPM-type phosphatase domain superfamily [Helianthus annuus]
MVLPLILSLGIFDGHNGSAAAIYTKENLLNNVFCAIPFDLNRDEWWQRCLGLWWLGL